MDPENIPSSRPDINIVVVPESVLRAFENSSHLNLEETDECAFTKFEINGEGHWIDLPETMTQSSSPECSQRSAQEMTSQNSDTQQKSNDEMSLKLYQNCLFIDNAVSDAGVLTCENMAHEPHLPSCLTMTVKSVENIGDKNVYTLAPTSLGNLTEVPPQGELKQVDHHPAPQELMVDVQEGELLNDQIQDNSLQIIKYESLSPYSLSNPEYMGEKVKEYKCNYGKCKWSFSTPYKLRRHMGSHLKRKAFLCNFPGCHKTFTISYNLKTHITKCHTEIPPNLVCKHCGVGSINKRDFQTHMRKMHKVAPKLKCTLCSQLFHTTAALVSHKRSHETSKINYPCPLCDKTYNKKCLLKQHLLSHTGEKPFACDQCSWRFPNVSRLNRHMLTHNDKMLRCPYKNCDKIFSRSDHLQSHQKLHIAGTNIDSSTDIKTFEKETTTVENLPGLQEVEVMTPPHDLIVDNEVEVTHDFVAEDEIKVDPSSSWSSPLLSSGMEEQHPQDELFIDGIAGLTDSSAEKLLQLSPNMCSVSTAEQQYALQQYVIGGESLDNIIEPTGGEDINAFRILSTSENEVAPLFKDTLVGAPHSNLFAGTTINLNDLQ